MEKHPLRDRVPFEFATYLTTEGKFEGLDIPEFVRLYEKAVARELGEHYQRALDAAKLAIQREFGVSA